MFGSAEARTTRFGAFEAEARISAYRFSVKWKLLRRAISSLMVFAPRIQGTREGVFPYCPFAGYTNAAGFK